MSALAAIAKAQFEQEAVPAMRKALQEGNINGALELETFLYANYVKKIETEEHYETCFSQWAPLMEAAGAKIAEQLPPITPPDPAPSPRRLGFFFHNAAVLAHTEVILSYLEGLHGMETPPFAPVIYVFSSMNGQHQPEFDARFTALGAEIHYLADYLQPANDSDVGRLLALRHLAAHHKISALVWVSLATHLAFASAMKVAPKLIWYSMRFHPKCFTRVDGRIGGGSVFEEKGMLNGAEWRTPFVAYKDTFDAGLTPEAERIRAHFAGKLILGVMGRPEKLMGEEYLWCVQQIMQTNPQAVFLWTGRMPEATAFQQALNERGIAERCQCIGWVNSKLYAQVFDLCLDSFPSGGGLTAIQTMAAGTPMVATNHMSMLGNFAYPAYHGTQGTREQQGAVRELFGPDFPCVATKEAYVAMAQKLIDNPTLRKKAGAAQKQFVDTYLSDRPGLARRLNKHFLTIIEGAEQ